MYLIGSIQQNLAEKTKLMQFWAKYSVENSCLYHEEEYD